MDGTLMSASLTIYNLYQLVGGSESWLLAKAERPDFPSGSQPAENAAIAAVDSRFAALVEARNTRLGFSEAKLMGTWEDAYPKGDVFYSHRSDVAVEVWLTHDTNDRRYFVFGIASSEQEFWNSLYELHADGDLWGFEQFARPASRQRAWLVQ